MKVSATNATLQRLVMLMRLQMIAQVGRTSVHLGTAGHDALKWECDKTDNHSRLLNEPAFSPDGLSARGRD